MQEVLEEGKEWSVEDLQEFQDIEKRLELVWKEGDALINMMIC